MSGPPERLAAALAGRYRIERELGQGGMATVYLAEDLKHKRRVALKVLKPELAAVLGAERFVQEITTTASLSHPHILPLFDSGEADGFLFYVMPFVDGETLRGTLDRETQLGVDEAVRITTEVADALEYAHQHGVIHRDIKPENILLQGGRPMVADFGIALAVSAAAGGRMTETGLSLGTPHYMSPEQATAEKEITARSDVYSLASVLYEMLTGNPPHTGASAQQIIMKIITEPPAAVTALRKSVPPNVAAAVGKALEKLPADRFASAKAFAEALTNPAYTHATTAVRGTDSGGRRRVAAWAAAALALAALAGGYLAGRSAGADADQRPVRFLVDLPDSLIGIARCCGQSMALTPDGHTLVFVGRTEPTTGMLYRLDMDQLQPRVIPGTEQGASPFISPDGAWLGFEAEGTIKKVRLSGGPVETIAVVGAGISSATWTDRDRIVYAVTATNNHLWTVGAAGGAPAMVVAPDSTPLTRLPYPFALPGGRVVLSSTEGDAGTLADRRIVAVHLETGRVDTIGVGTHAKYSRGQLFISGADGTLSVQSFDPAKLRTSGARTTILHNLARLGPWMFAFTVSDGGSLAYELASDGDPFGSGLYTRLMVADVDAVSDARPGRPARAAAPVPLPDPRPAAVYEPAVSPDGNHVVYRVPFMNATSQGEVRGDLYLLDLRTGVASRFSTRGATSAVWSRDGRSIAYHAIRSEGSPAGIYRRTVDHSSEPELIVAGRQLLPSSWAPDGRLLLTTLESAPATSRIGYVAPGDTAPRSILRPGVAASLPVVSQDGRWLAYERDRQIWMQPMEGAGVPVQVSAGLGEQPRWSRAGRTLYYIALPERTLVAATFTGASVSSRTTVSTQIAAIGTTQGAINWDIFPDGRRVIFTEPVLGGINLRLGVVRQWPALVRAMAENR